MKCIYCNRTPEELEDTLFIKNPLFICNADKSGGVCEECAKILNDTIRSKRATPIQCTKALKEKFDGTSE